jgi:hypothetical protein
MIARALVLVVFVLVCTATSCVMTTGIAIAPNPPTDSATAADRSFSLVERVIARYGMQAYIAPNQRAEAWIRCFAQEFDDGRKLILCGKLREREIHLWLREVMNSRFSPHADSVRGELFDSLRAEFGEQAVRECKWQNEFDSRRSGCLLPTQRDSVRTEPGARAGKPVLSPELIR